MKRKTILKRGGMFVLSAIMALTMCYGSAFAASIGNSGVTATSDTQLTVPKGVSFMNDDSVDCYWPGVTYTYSVAPATVAAGVTVTDADNHRTTVHAGPAGGLTLTSPSLTFASNATSGEAIPTSPAGVEKKEDITLNFNASAFERAGVYRYVLTDTTSKDTLYAAGIVRPDNYQTARYIDVFVKRNGSNMEVYGYALKLTNDSTTSQTAKDPGFVKDSTAEGANGTDRYKTYNVTLTKQVAGTLADTEHEFPFAATISNGGTRYQAAKGTVATAKAATATDNTSQSTTLKHGETYTIAGLSPKATVAYTETNDTDDLYEVTAAGSSSSIALTENATAKTYAAAAGVVSNYDTENSTSSVATVGTTTNYSAVTYTNTLDEVSPTGLVLRFGAYAFMIAMAFALIAAFRSREEVSDEI